MKNIARHFRLLPAVVVTGTLLLGLKGMGIVHDAMAQERPAKTADASPASATPADDGISAPRDLASDDTQTSSAAEVDVLSSLAKRRAELDARAKDQEMRENLLSATEKRVDDKITALKQLQAQITALLGQRDAAQEKQVASLVKTYSAMKPRDAARIFEGLNDDVLIPVAQEMKSDALAPILASMSPDSAQKLTVKLASKLSLPNTPPPALAPVETATAMPPSPAPTDQTAPAPSVDPSKNAAPGAAAPQAPGKTSTHG